MTARYWVPVSDELYVAGISWPDGLRLAQLPEPDPHRAEPWIWCLIEDDNAPPELDGKRVELILGRRGREGAKAVIIERRVIA